MPPGAIPFPFGDCRICNDKATGIHYGLATCEGCKGFFKRSIPKGDKYKCFFGGQCLITPQNRNRCKSCRYRKCIKLGMSFEAVKMGRIPKVEKQKALNAVRGIENGWKDYTTESPDTGLDEENNRKIYWNQSNMGNIDQGHIPDIQYFPNNAEGPFSGSLHKPSLASTSNMDIPDCSMSSSHSAQSNKNQNDEQLISSDTWGPNFNQEKFGTSNMNLLAEMALLPNGQMSSSDDSTGADSNGSRRSLYSSNVIKVLFNQVVEMTGAEKVPEVMEKLALKYPGSNSAGLLKHLSSESFLDGEEKSPAESDMLTSYNSKWQQDDAQLYLNGTNGFHESTSGGQPCRFFPDAESDLPVDFADFKSDTGAYYKEENKNEMLPVDENGCGSHRQYNYSSCAEGFASTPPEQNVKLWSDISSGNKHDESQLDMWLNTDNPVETEIDKHKSGHESQKIILDDTDKESEETFEKVILRLNSAMDKHNKMVRKHSEDAKRFREQKIPMKKEEITEQRIKEIWNQLFISVQVNNERIIGFCGDVPGFSKLHVDDQKILLKRAYYDIWMLTASEFLTEGESYLQFPDGSFYTRQWMEYVIQKENVELLFDFAESFNKLNLTELEIAIIAVVELTSPGHVDIDLKDAAAIQKLNSLYLDLLVYVITKRNPDNSSRILIDIFRLLPKLAKVNKMQQDLVANFSKDKPPS